ncbi:centromere protein O isoform X2 [Rhinopithecus roxellana]|uniref:centromere protein O isoform X2 n=1 Tax=Rhinopithecus roxellana TaxID=61622 RepID=UPI0012374E99|nr:centromere protein O isoform X2 [Rhinopithecus roxellana]
MEQANPLRPDGESKGGVLAHLERLETQVSRSRKQSEELQSVQAQEGALGTKIHKLRHLRDELRAAVRHRRGSVKARIANVEPNRTVEVNEQEALEEKLENVKAVLQAYHFTETIPDTSPFSPSLHSSGRNSCKILTDQHPALPVQSLRIPECLLWEEVPGRPASGGQSFPFCARLLYKDLTATLPTDVTVTCQGEEALSTSWEEQRASHETLFCTKPLHQVFASFARREKLDGSGLLIDCFHCTGNTSEK